MASHILSQFRSLPVPEGDLTGKTVIVTGANIGLGLEASRHFARLNAARIILACRDLEKAEAARKQIETSLTAKEDGKSSNTAPSPAVLEVWKLDLASFDNVKEFAARAAKELDRVDYLMCNASVASGLGDTADGWELHIGVNVIATFLLAVLMLPKMRETGSKYGVLPRLCITASAASHLAFFNERKEKRIFESLNANRSNAAFMDRYNVSKLLQVILAKHLAVAARASGRGDVIINSVHPGLCNTELFRSVPWPISIPFNLGLRVFGRTPEMGSRCLMAGVLTGDDQELDKETTTNGRYMENCVVAPYPNIMNGDEGERMQERVWEEILEILEDVQPGVRKNI